MPNFIHQFRADFFEITPQNFEDKALQLFDFQAKNNPTYRQYLNYLRTDISKIHTIEQIPFLPIRFFKNHQIRSIFSPPTTIFRSSGTTGQITSQHYVTDLDFYHQNSQWIFEQFYGKLVDFELLALLPSYLERSDSSLVEMARFFMAKTGSESGFYLDNFETLAQKIEELNQKTRPILLLGVTFALLDFAEKFQVNLENAIIMETGGMKGKRPEMTREEVHQILIQNFGCQVVHSEYGMTELLSQAYSKGDGIFKTPPTLRILLREPNDPFCINSERRNGGINIIDLANIESCAFIETQDLGSFETDGFRVLGRFDNSDLRGCNLMVL